ncbi:MAG: seryl-tRNA synthetase [Anaerolineae bacterium SG8_19]|nr:MAG: seryl-tRNA synthetase [Anaerolineae bacterium SG8_19]
MLDIRIIREKPDWVKEEVAKLNDSAPIDEIIALDQNRRQIIQLEEELRQKRNASSKEVGQLMGNIKRLEKEISQVEADSDTGEEISQLQAERVTLLNLVEESKMQTRQIGEQIAKMDDELRDVESNLHELMLWVPNLPHESVPIGPDDSYNVTFEPVGAPLPTFEFEPLAHWDLGPALGILDFDRGVKLSGSRFYILKGGGARLQRALIQLMLDYHVNEHQLTEIYPPYMVRSEMLVGAAQLPKFAENIYRDAEDDFMWIGTAEVALTNIHRDELLDEADLPLNYVAYTACFRREKMSAGRDVRGIKRGHQFDKVEMYKFTTPETSYQALEELISYASDICEVLGLPYRLVEMSTGDLGFAASKKYDIEVWAAGCQEWLEVSSISNCEAFQARRANVRYRPADGGRPRFVHTLNGSGLALPRVLIALMENNQQADGTIRVPDVLRPYMGGRDVIDG